MKKNLIQLLIIFAMSFLIIKLNAKDITGLKGFEKITFFFDVPCTSAEVCSNLENFGVAELKKAGHVTIESFSVETLTKKLREKDSLLKNPFLTYKLEKIKDMQGNELPYLQASLTFDAPVTTENTKTYCRSVLWESMVFVKAHEAQDNIKIIEQTFSSLLDNFKSDYYEENPNKSKKLEFYFAK